MSVEIAGVNHDMCRLLWKMWI